jgi:hypothetical protein
MRRRGAGHGREFRAMRSILLYLLGVPITVIIALNLFGVL